MPDEKKAARRSGARKDDTVWSEEERVAIREYTRERKRASSRSRSGTKDAGDGEADVLAKIATLDEPDRAMAQRIHALVRAAGPELTSRTWYGSPAYYRDGQLICFFQERAKFKVRYATLGFSDKAHLDDGPMWPSAYALTEMTPAVESRITALVKQALG